MWRYVVATLTFIALGIYTYALGERVISRTRGYAALLNAAGRQRMLSQRTVLFIRASADASGEESSNLQRQAEQALAEARAGHAILLALRDGVAQAPYTDLRYGWETRSLFDGDRADARLGVHALMDTFLLDAGRVVRDRDIPSILALRKYTQDLLVPRQDQFVQSLQHDAEAVVAQLEHEMLFVSALFALALLLQGAIVYTPLVRSLRRALRAQQDTNAAQQESMAYARAIARCSSDAFIVHRDGKIIDWNQNAITMFGYSEEELKGSPPWMIADPGIHDLARQRVRDQITAPFEFVGVRKDGTRFYVQSYAQHYDAVGGPVRVSSLRDITLQKETEESQLRAIYAAEQAAQSRLDFLANMSHEIRTPLNGIIGMTDLMMETQLTSEQSHYGSIIHNSSSHLLSIINDILDLSKIESGKMQIENARLEVSTLVESQAELFLGKAREKSIELRTFVDPQLPAVLMGDGGRINQILLNFINNAIKFTEKGSVTVRADLRRVDDVACTLQFSVTDTGIGMEPEVQNRLFLPFSQADASTARRFGGTGLGLSICKQLAALMNGQVGVDSVPGQGSTFWLVLRLQAAEAAPPQTSAMLDGGDDARMIRVPRNAPQRSTGVVPVDDAPHASGGGGPRKRVLVAEDNSVNQLLVLTHLKRLGYTAQAVSNGKEALTALDLSPWDLVLMDCQMPEMDGYEAAQAIRQREPQDRHIPIVALTANAMQEDRERCLRAGMDDYITKPVNREQLQHALERWLSRLG